VGIKIDIFNILNINAFNDCNLIRKGCIEADCSLVSPDSSLPQNNLPLICLS
jgi:hypothetical protein